MGVVQNYNVGGIIDEVKKINWPAHLFPRFTKPFTKGFSMNIPPIDGTYELAYIAMEDLEMVNVGLACSGYKDTDEWELTTEAPGETEYTVVETMPTRELAESINMGNVLYIVHQVPKGTVMRFKFHNNSGTSKVVWPSARFLRN